MSRVQDGIDPERAQMTATVSPGILLQRLPDASALARAAAELVVRAAEEAVSARGAFSLVLAGGSTPRALYQLLADPAGGFRARVAWTATQIYFGDERAVPPDHADSNFRMARSALLEHVTVGWVHRMEGELGAPLAAERYEQDLRRAFGAVPFPAFDLVLLGLGSDGHTASLFPGSPALGERARWAVAAPGPAPQRERITLTVPVLEQARQTLFLVAGPDKAAPLRRLLRPRPGEEPVPAGRLRFRGAARVLADAAAAGELEDGDRA